LEINLHGVKVFSLPIRDRQRLGNGVASWSTYEKSPVKYAGSPDFWGVSADWQVIAFAAKRRLSA
jgi:hypothetical protein